MSTHLHLQAALAAAKAQHCERTGLSAVAREMWRDAALLEATAADAARTPTERARLRKSAALFAVRAGDPSLAGDILGRARTASAALDRDRDDSVG